MKQVLIPIITLCVLFLTTISIKEIIKEYMRVNRKKLSIKNELKRDCKGIHFENEKIEVNG